MLFARPAFAVEASISFWRVLRLREAKDSAEKAPFVPYFVEPASALGLKGALLSNNKSPVGDCFFFFLRSNFPEYLFPCVSD